MNADDLIGGHRTIKVTRVAIKDGDQPIAINFEGDGNKPYKPCKSMRRVLLKVWGSDGEAYAGRRMTLYRDDAVQFGGVAVGGIRISHMSGIPSAVTMALTVTKAVRRPFTVRPLAEERAGDAPKPKSGRERLMAAAREAAAAGEARLRAFRADLTEQQDAALAPILAELERAANDADAADDGFPGADALTREPEAA